MKLFDEIIFSIYTVLIILFFYATNVVAIDVFYKENNHLFYMLIHLISLILMIISIITLINEKKYEH